MKTFGHYTGRAASLLLTRILFLDRLKSEPLEWSYLFFSQCILVYSYHNYSLIDVLSSIIVFFLFEIHLISEVGGEDPLSG